MPKRPFKAVRFRASLYILLNTKFQELSSATKDVSELFIVIKEAIGKISS